MPPLSEIRERLEKATKGPWTHRVDTNACEVFREKGPYIAGVALPENAEFIAHSREDIPALLKMIEMKDEALKAARRILSIYVTDDSPKEDIIDANMIDDALAIGHGGEGVEP